MDTLQIYFAWDDDLYTYLKEKGFGSGGFKRKTLPIIYSDNCQSTSCVQERKRKYLIHPRYFGKTHEELGWKPTDKETEPIISSEKPQITVSLIDDNLLEFRINPRVDGKEQYHLEYSTMSSFGRLYTNWAIPVLTINDFKDLLAHLREFFPQQMADFSDVVVNEETKQNQRERMYYVKVPLKSYKFSIGEFLYAKEFFSLNGFKDTLPSLVFRNEPSYLEIMEPILKVGFVHTTAEQGFEVRKPQIALKIAQNKMTTSLRGKKSKAKGKIEVEDRFENYFVVPADTFAHNACVIANKYSTAKKQV